IQALLLVDPARQRRWLAGRPPSPAALAQMASLAEEPRDGGGPASVEASGAYHTTAFGGATLGSLHDISPMGRAAPNQEQSMFRAYVQLDPRSAAPLRPEDEIALKETFRVEGLLRAAQVVVSLTPYGRASLRSPMPEITLAIGLLCTLGAV